MFNLSLSQEHDVCQALHLHSLPQNRGFIIKNFFAFAVICSSVSFFAGVIPSMIMQATN